MADRETRAEKAAAYCSKKGGDDELLDALETELADIDLRRIELTAAGGPEGEELIARRRAFLRAAASAGLFDNGWSLAREDALALYPRLSQLREACAALRRSGLLGENQTPASGPVCLDYMRFRSWRRLWQAPPLDWDDDESKTGMDYLAMGLETIRTELNAGETGDEGVVHNCAKAPAASIWWRRDGDRPALLAFHPPRRESREAAERLPPLYPVKLGFFELQFDPGCDEPTYMQYCVGDDNGLLAEFLNEARSANELELDGSNTVRVSEFLAASRAPNGSNDLLMRYEWKVKTGGDKLTEPFSLALLWEGNAAIKSSRRLVAPWEVLRAGVRAKLEAGTTWKPTKGPLLFTRPALSYTATLEDRMVVERLDAEARMIAALEKTDRKGGKTEERSLGERRRAFRQAATNAGVFDEKYRSWRIDFLDVYAPHLARLLSRWLQRGQRQ